VLFPNIFWKYNLYSSKKNFANELLFQGHSMTGSVQPRNILILGFRIFVYKQVKAFSLFLYKREKNLFVKARMKGRNSVESQRFCF